jgi:hypothetical protein
VVQFSWICHSLEDVQQEGQVMKKLLLLVMLAGLTALASGCATPAYSARERRQMIARNWDFEWKQAQDDIDGVLLLRPASRLTIWNVR